MTTTAAATSASEGVLTLRAAVDELLAADVTMWDGTDVVDVLAAVEVERRRLDAVDARLLAEVADRGVAGELGRTSAADLLTTRLLVSRSEAKARVRRARQLGPRRSVVGEPLDPLLPEASTALTAGRVSAAHANVIGQVLDLMPPELPAQDVRVCERLLVEASQHLDPVAVRRYGRRVIDRLDPDGREPRERRQRRLRDFTLGGAGADGVAVRGRWTDECAAMWQVILDVLSAPRPVTLPDGTVVADDRSPAQRRHDAMEEAARRLLRSGTLPDSGGVPATLIVTAGLDELRHAGGVVRTAHGELIGLDKVLALAGELGVELCVTSDVDAPPLPQCAGRVPVLAYGRTQRLASSAQRKALAARDGAGCCFPACTRPLAWTQAHHIVRWDEGGRTDLDNLCLVCTFHHRLLDGGDWRVIMANDGRPSWIPPPWIDPARSPVRNAALHLPKIDFGQSLPPMRA